jgi:DnaK suppressor protein
LLKLLETLESTEKTARDAAATVELDQTRVGRLSRMDALQSQAMSLETIRRREAQIRRIHVALERLANDEYGECVSCGEWIDPRRLEFDPSVLTCFECARASERDASQAGTR